MKAFSYFAIIIVAASFLIWPIQRVYSFGENVRLEKKTYIKNANGTIEERAEFRPGDTIIAQVKFSAPSDLTNLELVDQRPKQANIPLTVQITREQCQVPADINASNIFSKKDTSGNIDNPNGFISPTDKPEEVIWKKNLTGTTSGADLYFCYQYSLDTDEGNGKNLNFAVSAVMYQISSGGDDRQDMILAKADTFLMVIGYPWINSQTDPTKLDDKKPYEVAEIKDKFFQLPTTITSKGGEVLTATNSSVYSRSRIGKESRGGLLINLPTKVTNTAGDRILGSDNVYVLYNPAFYLFGNLFSGGANAGTAFDFNSRSSAISKGLYNGTIKQNSEASIFDYNIDQNSTIYWDEDNLDKNKAMEKSIRKLAFVDPKPDITCENTSILTALKSGSTYLNNINCNPVQYNANSDKTWPSGRVWYVKANSDIDINTTFRSSGTIIVDFSGAAKKVTLHTKDNNFASGASVGLMVINGGNVEFADDAQYYRGIIFVPGSANAGGQIVFTENGNPVKISGSLVANQIDFNKRNKTDSAGVYHNYSIEILADAKVLYSVLPGFENIYAIINQ